MRNVNNLNDYESETEQQPVNTICIRINQSSCLQGILCAKNHSIEVRRQGSTSFRSYTFDTQILCNYDSRFLPKSYRSVIGISSYIAWCDTEGLKRKGIKYVSRFCK